MSKQKLVVYLTYGVYLDLDEPIEMNGNDLDDEAYVRIRELAVQQMWSHGVYEVSQCADAEIEDVTKEFENE